MRNGAALEYWQGEAIPMGGRAATSLNSEEPAMLGAARRWRRSDTDAFSWRLAGTAQRSHRLADAQDAVVVEPPPAECEVVRPVQEKAGDLPGMAYDGLVCLLMGLVRLYQLTLSPFVGGQCRFHPTCSHYALRALASHGPFRGTWLAVKRLSKCHPFHPGGIDPPPMPPHRDG